MKKIIHFALVAFVFLGVAVTSTNAQMMMHGVRPSDVNWNEIIEHTVREEKEGKDIWKKFQAKEITCADLADEQFGVLGEYFMGQMMGDSHAAMNAMMMQMHGEEGEEQIHIAMGKRLTGCNTSAALPVGGDGWMPMMNMMTGRWSSPFGFNSPHNMMNFGLGFGFFGWIFMILWWVLIIVAVIALIKWLANQLRSKSSGQSTLDILKERYAKGEINKQEFDEKKKNLE